MREIKLSLKIYGEPILRKKTARIDKFDSALEEIFNQMVRIMRVHKGIGLAATQVGLDTQIFIVDIGDGVYKICNPQIIKKKGWQTQEEGCLSLPGIMVNVKRPNKIVLRHQDVKGKTCQIECDGLLSRAIQHELDHINGKLIIDYLPWVKRVGLRNKLKRHLDKS